MVRNSDSMLWLDMGLGKTVITLTVMLDRMRAGLVSKTLILGPLRVVESVWEHQSSEWEHTQHLKFSIMTGTKKQRLNALFSDADVYLINYESLNWLAETLTEYYLKHDKPLPFQMCVYDEVSKMKNSTSLRFAGGKRDRKNGPVKLIGWRKMIEHFDYRVGLTGTPAANGYLDLHGQYLAVDGGKRLGQYVTHFKDNYFESDYMGWGHTVTDRGQKSIEEAISDITIEMDAADYLDLPDCSTVDIMVDLPKKCRGAYDQMEADMFTRLENGTELEVFSRASVSNKLLQFANGSAYLEAGSTEFEALHDAKLQALDSILEEACGSPVLCSYTYKADAERIMKKFKKYKPVNLTKVKTKDVGKTIKKWNKGLIKLMIGHPASIGHGIDGLQKAGHIVVWFGLPWSLELYMQMNKRIDRQGQAKKVTIFRILCNDTVDLAVMDAIERKDTDQEGLKDALQRYKNITK